MQYPERVQKIIDALWASHRDLANGDDDQRRALTLLISQQIRFEKGPSWGTKSAGAGRPPSKDTIVEQWGETLLGWDWQNGTTRQPNQYPASQDLTGQIFIAVDAIDHLGVSAPPALPADPPPASPPVDPAAPPAWVATLAARLEALDGGIQTLLGRPAAPQTFRAPIQAGITALFGFPPNPAGEIVLHGDKS